MCFPKLRGRIREKFGTQAAFAEAMGLHPSTLVKKLAGKTDWTWLEVQKAVDLLDIPHDLIAEYFFADKVA